MIRNTDRRYLWPNVLYFTLLNLRSQIEGRQNRLIGAMIASKFGRIYRFDDGPVVPACISYAGGIAGR